MIRTGLAAITVAVVAPSLVNPTAIAVRQEAGFGLTINAIASPAGTNTGEPQLTVSDRRVLLSWIERDGSTMALRFAERTPTGWTEARTAVSGSDWSLNAVDVPAVLRLADGTLVANWLQKAGSGMHANDVRLSYSKDDGRTWAPSFKPHRDSTPNERGFVSLFPLPGGALGVIWLDGPAMAAGTGHGDKTAQTHSRGGDHAGHQGGGRQGHGGGQGHGGRGGEHGAVGPRREMTVRFASFDTAWKQTVETVVDSRACECCPTAAVATSEGVVAAYRNRSDEEVRDIYVTRFDRGRWSEPAPVHADNWRIPGCPVNGPAVSASGRNVAIAWYTVKNDQGQAYAALSRDGGRTFGKPTRLDDRGSLGRVDVGMLADGSALATWLEVADAGAQFRARRVTLDGARSAPVTVAKASGSRAGGALRVSRSDDEFVFAWTESENGTPRVRTATARVAAKSTQ